MTQQEEEAFVKQAFQALIDRGVAKPEYFTPSPVSDEELAAFEEKYQVVLPSLLKTFLKSYCYEFYMICAPVPWDPDPDTIQSEEYEMHLLWLELLSVPMENPLGELAARIECFREMATGDFIEMEPETVAHLLPVGDYGGAGPLCIDLTLTEETIDINNMDTWSIQFFDHEEFDWKNSYLEDSGLARGSREAPDFKTLLEWYFYGKFDRA